MMLSAACLMSPDSIMAESVFLFPLSQQCFGLVR